MITLILAGTLQGCLFTDSDPTSIQYGRVAGKVVDERGESVKRGWLFFEPDLPEDIGYGFRRGAYQLDLPPGKYSLTLGADGYESETQVIEVETGSLVIDFVLRRSQ